MRSHALRRLRSLRLPLTLCLALLLVGVVLAVGIALGLHNYRQTSRIVRSAAEARLDDTAREVALELDRDLNPAQLLVQVVAAQPITRTTTLEARERELPTLAGAFRQVPSLTAVYVGYPDGSFFLVRALRDDATRAALHAPAAARFVVQSVEQRPVEAADIRFLSLREDLTPIEASARPEFAFDPRTRGWYRSAIASDQAVLIGPYTFFTTREPGITYARKAAAAGVVVGADVTLASLSQLLRRQHVSPSSALLLVTADGGVVAQNHPDEARGTRAREPADRLPMLAELPLAAAPVLAQRMASKVFERRFEFQAAGRDWIGSIQPAADGAGTSLYLAVASPVDELMADANRMRDRSLVVTVALIAIATLLASLVASRVSRTLRTLAAGADRINSLDFDDPPRSRSIVREIDRLEGAMGTARTSVRRFLQITNALAAERHVDRLIERVLVETMALAHAGAAAIHFVDGKRRTLEPAQYVRVDGGASSSLGSIALDGESNRSQPLARAALGGMTILAELAPQDFADRAFLGDETAHFQGRVLAVLAIPLRERSGDVIGVLTLLSDKVRAADVRPQLVAFIEKVSGVAAIALETQRLIGEQKALLEAFIELVAAAIDAKSPYTGGHCQRVPEITRMLAQAACDARDGPFRDFRLSDDEWEAVRIASWLHDCGKVTTPEYVVDKATKLETLYDRIHEVRMRFEVLKRDAEIEYWKGLCAGGDKAALAEELAARRRALDDDFAFVASCNEGGESMDEASCRRILSIAGRTWQRTLDDRLGTSWEERSRRGGEARALPATEPLLGDAPHHVVERTPAERMTDDNRWGFRLDVPEHRYNRGEIHSLLVTRGTLTDEERYKINDHIVQTIIMLDKLPFPRHLAQVPEIAAGHHERMDGRGYPRRLTREQMSPVARMMAIADIFEALTAADRPYKKGKPLSETIAIMARMRDEQHIDADLFDLFLASGIPRRYAERFLRPEQVDDIDVDKFRRWGLSRVPVAERAS
jgi:HD-GYP domain-containing protein (c-di-GMP phosphodiesterase class II)